MGVLKLPKYCPKCEQEVLPYLKTGEIKELRFTPDDIGKEIVSYQCYYCLNCRCVLYEEHERYPFVDVNYKIKTKEKKENGTNKKTANK